MNCAGQVENNGGNNDRVGFILDRIKQKMNK